MREITNFIDPSDPRAKDALTLRSELVERIAGLTVENIKTERSVIYSGLMYYEARLAYEENKQENKNGFLIADKLKLILINMWDKVASLFNLKDENAIKAIMADRVASTHLVIDIMECAPSKRIATYVSHMKVYMIRNKQKTHDEALEELKTEAQLAGVVISDEESIKILDLAKQTITNYPRY